MAARAHFASENEMNNKTRTQSDLAALDSPDAAPEDVSARSRRDVLKHGLAAVAAFGAFGASAEAAELKGPVAGRDWWPSKWGATTSPTF